MVPAVQLHVSVRELLFLLHVPSSHLTEGLSCGIVATWSLNSEVNPPFTSCCLVHAPHSHFESHLLLIVPHSNSWYSYHLSNPIVAFSPAAYFYCIPLCVYYIFVSCVLCPVPCFVQSVCTFYNSLILATSTAHLSYQSLCRSNVSRGPCTLK